MKRNDFIDIKNLDLNSLEDKVRILKGELAEVMLDKNMSKIKDIKSVGKKKKDIAQVLTVIRQKQLLEALEEETKIESKGEKVTG